MANKAPHPAAALLYRAPVTIDMSIYVLFIGIHTIDMPAASTSVTHAEWGNRLPLVAMTEYCRRSYRGDTFFKSVLVAESYQPR